MILSLYLKIYRVIDSEFRITSFCFRVCFGHLYLFFLFIFRCDLLLSIFDCNLFSFRIHAILYRYPGIFFGFGSFLFFQASPYSARIFDIFRSTIEISSAASPRFLTTRNKISNSFTGYNGHSDQAK